MKQILLIQKIKYITSECETGRKDGASYDKIRTHLESIRDYDPAACYQADF
jgi:hypothetical protein